MSEQRTVVSVARARKGNRWRLLRFTRALAMALALGALPGAAVADDGADPAIPLDVLVARGQALAVKQDWAGAEAVLRSALDRDAERADAWRTLGWVLRKQGHPSDARDAYEKALALAPADAETLLGLGETYVAVGRKPDAVMLLERLRAADARHAATLEHVIRTGQPR